MQEEYVVDDATPGPHKYRRVFPIIGLLLYYLGCLIISLDLDAEGSIVFLAQIGLFSVILIAGLQWPPNKIAVILGAGIVILGSIGPLANLLLSIQNGIVGFGLVGGILVLIGVIFQVGAIVIWLKEPW